MQSISEQTFEDFEVLAVDDGSTDSTGTILREWTRRDGRVRCIETQPLGIVHALNLAAERAHGELLARMDADDVAEQRRLALQVMMLDTIPDMAGCGTMVRYFPRANVRDGALRYEEWINSIVSSEDIERDLFVECPIPHPTLVIRRETLEQIGGYRDNGWPEDYDLILRLWRAGLRLGKVPETLLHWREAADRLSRVDSRYDELAFRRCKVHYLGHRIAGRMVVICGAGPVGKAFCLELQAHGHTVAAFLDLDARKIGQTIHGARVFHPDEVGSFRDCYLLAAVGSAKGRGEIRSMWKEAGFREPQHCCAVA
jgi:glycosyltransferase involved in cell wall biosynthesis